MKWSHLVKKEVPVEVTFGEETFTVVYNPLAITAETEEVLDAISAGEKPQAKTAELMADLILRWDITDDEDNPILPTTQVLREIPTLVMAAIVSAVMDDLPNHNTARAGSAG